jgi:hypothetical protein
MKKIIKTALSYGFMIGIVIVSYNSYSNKLLNSEFKLPTLPSMSQAFAVYSATTKVEMVVCYNKTITLDDGTTTVAHKVSCTGEGKLECKCYCGT